MFLLAAKNAKEKKALAKNMHEKLLFLKKNTRTSTPGELGQAHITQKSQPFDWDLRFRMGLDSRR